MYCESSKSQRLSHPSQNVVPTRPLLFSTHTAFFLRSIHNGPAKVVVMVEGGVYRRPGPSLRGVDDLRGTGRTSSDKTCPGITSICAAMAARCNECPVKIRCRTQLAISSVTVNYQLPRYFHRPEAEAMIATFFPSSEGSMSSRLSGGCTCPFR